MDMETRQPVGPVFRRLRKDRKLSLAEVAAAIAWDGPNLSRSERGLQELTERRLYQLSAFFGIRPADAYAMADSSFLEDDDAPITTRLITIIGKMETPQRERLLEYAQFLMSNK